MPRTTFLLAGVLCAVVGGCGHAVAAPVVPPRAGDRIAFGPTLTPPPTPARMAYVTAPEGSGFQITVSDDRARHTRVIASPRSARGTDVGYIFPSWSPDGRRLAFLRRVLLRASGPPDERIYHEALHLYVTDSRLRPHRVPHWEFREDGEEAGGVPAWSPDGRLAAVPSSRGVALVDVRSGSTKMLLRGAASGARFSPDGRAVAFSGPGGIWRYDLATRALHRAVQDGFEPAWSPDSRRIAFTTTRDHNGSYAVHEAPDETANEIYSARADGATSAGSRAPSATSSRRDGSRTRASCSTAARTRRASPRSGPSQAVAAARGRCRASRSGVVTPGVASSGSRGASPTSGSTPVSARATAVGAPTAA